MDNMVIKMINIHMAEAFSSVAEKCLRNGIDSEEFVKTVEISHNMLSAVIVEALKSFFIRSYWQDVKYHIDDMMYDDEIRNSIVNAISSLMILMKYNNSLM